MPTEHIVVSLSPSVLVVVRVNDRRAYVFE